MKTLKDKIRIDNISYDNIFFEDDVKKHLNNFYNDYWDNSYEGDKFKKHITCDELDYFMQKHFGSLLEIDTLQNLESNKKSFELNEVEFFIILNALYIYREQKQYKKCINKLLDKLDEIYLNN